MTHLICPECALPAEIVDRFSLDGTDGPVEHVKIVCRSGHGFTPMVEDVAALQAGAQPQAA